MNSASSIAAAGEAEASAPSAIASGMKSISIASNWPLAPPPRASQRSSCMKISAPSRNSPNSAVMDSACMACGTSTSDTAASRMPPPSAVIPASQLRLT